jgi:DNA polymerase III delta prime subunit
MKRIEPTAYIPDSVDGLIGPAAEIARVLLHKASKLKKAGKGTIKVLLYGPPGVGKTTIANLLATEIAGTGLAIESVSGLNVTIDLVREWSDRRMGNLFSPWTVYHVDEVDRIGAAAQDAMLKFMDDMPDRTAFIGTSNMQLDLLADRFQSRFQSIKVLAPETKAIGGFLGSNWPTLRKNKTALASIALGSGGNVRAALLDAQTQLDVLEAA